MNWLTLAFIAPLLWAIVSLIDTYFVHGVYERASDGAIISGVFQSMPWLFVALGYIEFNTPPLAPTLLSLLAGGLFLISVLAYFHALFASNDGALMQTFWNFTVLVVPFVAWLLIGERLSLPHYLGIGLSFAGLAAFAVGPRSLRRTTSSVLFVMTIAVLSLSLSMVVSKESYRLSDANEEEMFWNIYLVFCVGASTTGLLIFFIEQAGSVNAGIALQGRRIGKLCRQYAGFFFFAESISLLGSLASQRAISLAPSASLVALIESLVPVFVMLACLLMAPLWKKAERPGIAAAYAAQLSHPARKAFALALIAAGIYMVN